jgi:hypothetical protein
VILRVAAALALLLGGALLLVYLHLIGRAPWSSPEMRHLRAMKERTAAPAAYEPLRAADFVALPHRAPLAETARLEARGVSFTGWVQALVTAPDGDVHFELTDTSRAPDAEDTTYVTAEVTPAWTAGRDGWSFERLASLLHPNHGVRTPWPGGPRRARVSGWLCYDFQYDVDRPVMGNHPRRLTGWEIHPVTRLEVWDDARGRFVEVAR